MWCLAYFNEVQHKEGYTTFEDIEPIQFFYVKMEAERAESEMYIMQSKLANKKPFGIFSKEDIRKMES